MMIVDNSDQSRNGDVFPNRLAAQLECVTMLASRVTSANLESAVGLLAASGELLCTPTQEPSAVLATFPRIVVGGRPCIAKTLSISLLALKHRANQNQHERVVLFVASPPRDPADKLFALATELRRNHVRLDLICLAGQEQVPLLRRLHSSANSASTEALFLAQSPGGERLVTAVQEALYGSLPSADDEDRDYQLAIQLSLQEAEQHSADQALLSEVIRDLNLDVDQQHLEDLLSNPQPTGKKDEEDKES